MNARRHASRTASILWIGALALVVLAQTLGWMHRAVHGAPHLAGLSPAASAVSADAGPAGSASTHPHGVDALFSGHSKASDCQLLDAFTHADGLPAAAVALPVAPALAWVAIARTAGIAEHTLATRARGPPASH